jgi:alanine racemase
MSHLVASDVPSHALNEKQLKRFAEVRRMRPDIPGSLANSSGLWLGKPWLHDLTRPGIALYGGNPVAPKKNPMKPVAVLEAKVMQVRPVKKGETVGYNATWKAPRDSRIALLGAGYADGINRKLSSSKPDGPAQAFAGGKRVPIIGRVSMDMMAIDVTALKPNALTRGDTVELFGRRIPVDEAASWAGTISYEFLTHLGKRYARHYSRGQS